MKQSRSRSRNLHRDEAASVICLPALPPLAPSPEAAPQLEFEVTRAALPLPAQDEPHVARRRTRSATTRTTANAQTSRPQAKRTSRPPSSRKAKAATVDIEGAATSPSPAQDQPDLARLATPAVTHSLPALSALPLPRNLSLALVRTGGLVRFGSWLRSLVMVKRPVHPAAQLSPATASQIKALRRDVAMMQKTLDQLLKGNRP